MLAGLEQYKLQEMGYYHSVSASKEHMLQPGGRPKRKMSHLNSADVLLQGPFSVEACQKHVQHME